MTCVILICVIMPMFLLFSGTNVQVPEKSGRAAANPEMLEKSRAATPNIRFMVVLSRSQDVVQKITATMLRAVLEYRVKAVFQRSGTERKVSSVSDREWVMLLGTNDHSHAGYRQRH